MSRIPQSKEALLKSYNTRLKEDVKSMLENFEGIPHNLKNTINILKYTINLFLEIIKLAKGENESQLSRVTQCEQDTYEMHVRAANIGRNWYSCS